MIMARPRKPTALKALQGTLRKHRENGAEPTPERSALPAPSHLSEPTQAAWRELVDIADGMGVLTDGDPIALEGMAGALADLRAARAALDAPLQIKSRDGNMITLAEPGELFYWTGGKGLPMRRARPE